MAFVPGELVIITLIERKGRFWGGNNRLPRIIQLLCFQQIGELVIITLIERKGRFWGGNNGLPRSITIVMFPANW